MHGDPWTLAEIDLLVRVATLGEGPSLDDDPFEGLPGPSPIAEGLAGEDAALAGSIAAAVAVGLIEPERAPELRALAERFRAQASASARAEPARADPLLGVRAVLGGPTPWQDGARVLALECYTGAVSVHWQHRRLGPVHPQRPERVSVPVWIADDVGTEYVGGGGDCGGWMVKEGGATFRPGIPAAARTLTVSVGCAEIGQAEIALDVAGLGERPVT